MNGPVVHFFFGQMGTGKSYLARKFATEKRLPFLEGDDLIPDTMRKDFGRILPPSMNTVKNFIEKCLAPGIEDFAAANPYKDIVVAQALYRNEHRLWLKQRLENPWNMNLSQPYSVKYYHVRTPFFQHSRQLLSRPNGIRWLFYSMLNKPGFQNPTHEVVQLSNKDQK